MTTLSFDHVLSPAKLNLFLHVIGQRADGYHLLQSAFVAIDWYDTLHFESRQDGKITRHDLNVPLPPDDLITRAAYLIQKKSGTSKGVDISIHKEIPMQAGLGGGSSNAATVLVALNHLWSLNLSMHELHTMAQQLGSDVPFFLSNGPSWVEGIGEKTTPLLLPPEAFKTPILVIKPNCGVSTQEIFKHPLMTRDSKPVTIMDFTYSTQNTNALKTFSFGKNDLQNAAIATAPEIGVVANWLTNVALAKNVRMTGSGSAVFGFTNNTLSESVNLPAVDWKLKTCRILDLHPQLQWLPIDNKFEKS